MLRNSHLLFHLGPLRVCNTSTLLCYLCPLCLYPSLPFHYIAIHAHFALIVMPIMTLNSQKGWSIFGPRRVCNTPTLLYATFKYTCICSIIMLILVVAISFFHYSCPFWFNSSMSFIALHCREVWPSALSGCATHPHYYDTSYAESRYYITIHANG